MALSEQELRRREEREKLMGMGIDPYPSSTFEISTTAEDINNNFKEGEDKWKEISIAGRMMTRRIMGSASFAEIQDPSGRLQIYVRRDDICPGEDKTLYNTVFKKMLDIGDIIGVKGFVFTTQTGEVSLHVQELTVLTKSLKPLPIVKEKEDEQGNMVKYDAFADPEMRYRQRYVDLIVNPQVRDTFKKRSQLCNSMREYLNERGYLEVELSS